MKSLWRLNFNLKSHWKFVTTYIGCPFCHQYVSVDDGEVNSRFKYCFYCGTKLTIEDNANEIEVKNMNKLIMLGRLVRDPEVRYTNNGKVVCQFTIAVDRPWQKDNVTADFIPCVTWSKQAETIGNYFHKGNKILVEGRLQISKYTNKEGLACERAECWVERFDFVEPKSDDGEKKKLDPMEVFGSVEPTEDIPF